MATPFKRARKSARFRDEFEGVAARLLALTVDRWPKGAGYEVLALSIEKPLARRSTNGRAAPIRQGPDCPTARAAASLSPPKWNSPRGEKTPARYPSSPCRARSA